MMFNIFELIGICVAALCLVIKLFFAIWKTRWTTVEASCTECELHQSLPHYRHFRKRHYLSGYHNKFLYHWNDKEITGSQLFKYNPGQYTPGYMYQIKVNPRRPHVIATKVEIIWDYIFPTACMALMIAIFIS